MQYEMLVDLDQYVELCVPLMTKRQNMDLSAVWAS